MNPAIAYSIRLVIHARIMNDVMASAPCVLGSMPSGANQSATGTAMQSTATKTRVAAFCGMGVSAGRSAALVSTAVIGLSVSAYRGS